MTTSPYLPKVLEAEVTITTDAKGNTAFRIAAPSRNLVEKELARLLRRLTQRRARWMATGPTRWEPVWVVHGEIHEAVQDAPHGLDVAR
jgi:hypothetical protein